jgi:hypothetical protein
MFFNCADMWSAVTNASILAVFLVPFAYFFEESSGSRNQFQIPPRRSCIFPL